MGAIEASSLLLGQQGCRWVSPIEGLILSRRGFGTFRKKYLGSNLAIELAQE